MESHAHAGCGAPRGRLLLALLLCAAVGSCAAARMPPSRQTLRILAIGDSITEGAVPSIDGNHPYTGRLQLLLRRKYPGVRISINNQGVGGAGIYAVGFHKPTTIPPVARAALDSAPSTGGRYDYVIVMLGINDLLREGKPAEDVARGLVDIYRRALRSGANVIAIPPFPAPGFVTREDSKETERKKLAGLIKTIANEENGRHLKKITVLDLQSGPLDFYNMSDDDRKLWLDDGLHLTSAGYDKLAGYIASAFGTTDSNSGPMTR